MDSCIMDQCESNNECNAALTSLRGRCGAWRLHKYALKWRIDGDYGWPGQRLNRTRLHVVLLIFACKQRVVGGEGEMEEGMVNG